MGKTGILLTLSCMFIVGTSLAGGPVSLPHPGLKQAVDSTLGLVDPAAQDRLALTS